MNYATSADKQSATLNNSQSVPEKGSLTLQRKSNGHDAEALCRLVNNADLQGTRGYPGSGRPCTPALKAKAQTGITVSKANDPLEQETDRTSEKVMTLPYTLQRLAAEKAPGKEPGAVEEAPGEKGGKGKKKGKKGVEKKGKVSAQGISPGAGGEEPKGKAGKYLKQKSANVCSRAAAKAAVLADNEQTHDNAEEKTGQAEKAVEPPAEEGQAQSNAAQVEDLEGKKPPEPSEQEAKKTLNDAIDSSVPVKIKEMNQFRSKGKAKVIGNKVLGRVKKDIDNVQDTYKKIETPPPARKPGKPPSELPPEEVAPETPQLDLGKNAVPSLKKEHTDFSEFDRQSDKLLEKEGFKEEQLEMVDEGELLEAKQERKKLKKNVNTKPEKLQDFARQQAMNVDKDLREDEIKSRGQMRNKRLQGLAGAKDKQKKTRSSLELRREAVTKQINSIYERAKKSVTVKLNNLEKQSLKAFDQGQTTASSEFEYEVNRDINRWKRKRYSGLFGSVRWAKDKLFGIDDFPEVKAAFERARKNYVTKIDQLIARITKENEKAIAGCREEIATARKDIKKYVDSLGPDLKKIGQQSMEEMKSRLDDMDKFIDRKKDELARKLCDKKEEAIKKIDEKIEKMKEEMSGALSKLGNLLIEAALKFFKWALKKAGYSADRLMSIINKGKAVIKKIVGNPAGFIINIINAVKGGINSFVNNIRKHLVGGLISWLTGAMGKIGIQLPPKFNLKGIISIVLQILGLTWANIRRKLVKRLGEKVVGAAEKTFDIIKKIVTQGPMALWEMIKAKAAEIKQQVMDGIRNWAIVELVKQGVIKLLSFLNPAGAIVQAILDIYNTIMFFVDNWNKIVQFVKTVFNSIADIAMGKISAASAAVERAMAMTIPIILNFLARLLNLNGIGKAVKKIIMKIRKPIDKVIDKAVDFIAKKARALFRKFRKKVTESKRGNTATRKKNKRLAAAAVRQAMKRGIRRPDLRKLLLNLKKQFKLKSIVLNRNDDVVIKNSESEVIRGKPFKAEPEELALTEKNGKFRKTSGGTTKLGTYSASGDIYPTIHGAVASELDDANLKFPIVRLPANAERPSHVKAELEGKIEEGLSKDIERDSALTGIVGKLGDIESAMRQNRVSIDKSKYDGGHIIANRFGGPENFKNLVPQARGLNRGIYKTMENFTSRNLKSIGRGGKETMPKNQNSKVSIDVSLHYPGSVTSPLENIMKLVAGRAFLNDWKKISKMPKTTNKEKTAKESAQRQLGTKAAALHKELSKDAKSKKLAVAARIPTNITVNLILETDAPVGFKEIDKSKEGATGKVEVKDFIIEESAKLDHKGSLKSPQKSSEKTEKKKWNATFSFTQSNTL